MGRVDVNLLLSDHQAITGTTAISKIIDLGVTGGFMQPLYFDVKLSNPMTAGKITKVKVQSAATEDFTTPHDEVEVTVPTSVIQTRACTLAQFVSSIKYQNRFIRLVYTAEGAAGGKVFAYMTDGIQVGM